MSDQKGTEAKKDKIVSCAECRRKCDRIFPCSSCRKRGLTLLCPNIALPTRPRKQVQGTSKASVAMSEMAGRIRELEDALKALNGLHSTRRDHQFVDATGHELPSEPNDVMASDQQNEHPEEDVEHLGDSLGTLSINLESGNSSFFGQSASMEFFYHHGESSSSSHSGQFSQAKNQILHSFYPHVSGSATIKHLETQLPSADRAWALCDLYYAHAAWLYSAIPRAQFEKEILVPVYSHSVPSFSQTRLSPTDAGIMFMVFAIGSLLDPANPPEAGDQINPSQLDPNRTDKFVPSPDPILSEGCHYHLLARSALSTGTSVLEEPSISGVRIIFLMAFYHMLLDRKETPHNVWSLSSIAVGLAVSIGLHRDGRAWNLDPSVIEQRRALFWELYFFISLQVVGYSFHRHSDTMRTNPPPTGLAFGRPPQVTLPFIDCEIGDHDLPHGGDHHMLPGYRFRLKLIASTLLSDVRDLVFSTNKVQYKDVLLLDRKMRDCAVELFGGEIGGSKNGPDIFKGPNSAATMQRFFIIALKETMMVYLHRKYFVRACTARSEDLPRSKYWPSLLAAFRSAEAIIKFMKSLLVLEPELPRRFWFFWNHTLASAIIVGSVVIRHPRSGLAPDAMNSLECILSQLKKWSRGGERVDRPAKALKFVTQLHERARWALAIPAAAERTASPGSDGLSVLGGHARVFPTKLARSLGAGGSGGSSGDPSPSTDVHPALVHDLHVVNTQAWDRAGSQGYLPLGVAPPGEGGHDFDGMSVSAGAGAGGGMYDSAPPQGFLPLHSEPDMFGGYAGAGGEYFSDAAGPGGHMPPVTIDTLEGVFPAVAAMPIGFVDAGAESQPWVMEDRHDMSWQGFVAGLGLERGM